MADVHLAWEYNRPYDVFWPSKYGVSNDQIRAIFAIFFAKAKLNDLYSNKVVRPGDKFLVQTESAGVVKDRFLLVGSSIPHT